MATVNFLYRSKRDKAPLEVRLLYSVPLDEPKPRTRNGKTIFVYYDEKTISGKTQLNVTRDYWENDHDKQRINDIDRANFQKDVVKHLSKLEDHVLKDFQKAEPTEVNKDWLKHSIDIFYNPYKKIEAPTELIKFFEFYTDIKTELKPARVTRINVTKNKIARFEKHTGKTLSISDVNDLFKKDFTTYCDGQQYTRSTLNADFTIIKTVCRYAEEWEIKTSPQLKNLSAKEDRIKAPYLTFAEIEHIRSLDLPKGGYLDNARDWLIISCYTGQRVSDFMRFTPEMIKKTDYGFTIEFKQKKTGKLITIPFLEEAYKVIKKHNGNFPRPLSSQKYNDYIKEVCETAGFTEVVKGSITTFVGKDPNKATKNDYRQVKGFYKRSELITSHIGRRSFATNFYGEMPTSILIAITGHSSEKMFLKYIHKSPTDRAKEALKYFNQWRQTNK